MENNDSKVQENNKEKCSCKTKIWLLIILAAIITFIYPGLVKSVYYFVSDLFVPHQPYRETVQIDRKANLLDDRLSIARDCSYRVELRLLHKNKGMDEYKAILAEGDSLPYKPLPAKIDIKIMSTQKHLKKPFIHWVKEPINTGRSLSAAYYSLGSVYLIEGDYQLQLKVLNDSPVLRGIDVEVILQGPGFKFSCGKPTHLLLMQKTK